MSLPDTELSLDACLDRHRRAGGRDSLAVIATVDSTNRLARRIARLYLEADRPPPSLVLLAREQTAGRGRHGRDWVSPAGQGIYTSLLLSVGDAEALSALPLRVPLALCRGLAEAGVDCAIKWPNDLVVDGRKLGGVLIEALSGGRALIVGYGINGGQDEDDTPVPGATSLRLVMGRAPDLSCLAVDLARVVTSRVRETEPMAAVVEAYRERCVHRPGDRLSCRLGDRLVEGTFAGFDDLGRLRLDTGDGERILGSAELVAERRAGGAVAAAPVAGP